MEFAVPLFAEIHIKVLFSIKFPPSMVFGVLIFLKILLGRVNEKSPRFGIAIS